MNSFMATISRNKSGILLGLGLSSLVMSTIFAFRYAPEARDALEEKRRELNVSKLEPKDFLMTAGPYVLPSLISTGVGIGCVVGANQMNLNRSAASTALAAYAVSELNSFKAHTKEVVGDKKEKAIEAAVNKEIIERYPLSKAHVVTTGQGETLFFEKLSNTYFKSDIETLRKVKNDLNEKINEGEFISKNLLLMSWGLPPIILGDEEGWDLSHGLIDFYFDPQFTEDGRSSCLCIVFTSEPHHF